MKPLLKIGQIETHARRDAIPLVFIDPGKKSRVLECGFELRVAVHVRDISENEGSCDVVEAAGVQYSRRRRGQSRGTRGKQRQMKVVRALVGFHEARELARAHSLQGLSTW